MRHLLRWLRGLLKKDDGCAECYGGPLDGERRLRHCLPYDAITLTAEGSVREFWMLDAWELSRVGYTVIGWYALTGRRFEWRQMSRRPDVRIPE